MSFVTSYRTAEAIVPGPQARGEQRKSVQTLEERGRGEGNSPTTSDFPSAAATKLGTIRSSAGRPPRIVRASAIGDSFLMLFHSSLAIDDRRTSRVGGGGSSFARRSTVCGEGVFIPRDTYSSISNHTPASQAVFAELSSSLKVQILCSMF